ncbi:MAG: TonB-dependent receptor plug domain-containing protein [Desulfomonilia bacterium]
MSVRFPLFPLVVFLVLLSQYSPVSAEKIIIVAPPIEDEQHGSIAQDAPTAFTEIIQVDRSARGVIDTKEVLRITSSIDLPEYGGGVTAPVSLRGSNFQQTLIMVDGVSISPVTGDLVDLDLYTLPSIDRIEVVKGSTSAIYGKSSMGGVINLITPRPTFTNSLEATSSQGTYGYSLNNATINGHVQDVGILANVTRLTSENDFLYERDDGSTARRENNDLFAISALSKIWFDLHGWDTIVSGTLMDQERGSPGSEGSAGMLTPDDEVFTNRSSILVDTEKFFSTASSLCVSASRLHDRTHAQTMYSGDTWTKLTSDTLELSYRRKEGNIELRPGLKILREKLSSDEYGIHSRSTTAASLGADLTIDPVDVSLNLRHDISSEFDSRWTFHTGAIWRIVEYLDIRSNIGTGFREPTMGNLYAPSSWYVFIPNEDLDPETSFGWDVGPTLDFTTFGAGLCYFVTTYDDLIKMDFPAEMTFTYVNIDTAKASGIESYAWVRPHELLKISGTYTMNRFTYGSGIYESKTLKQKPENIATLIVDMFPVLLSKSVDLYVMYQFREGVYADEANTIKTGNRNILDAGCTVKPYEDASISFKVNNIFNDTSREFEDSSLWGNFWYPVPGRTYRFSVQFAF